MEIEIDSVDEVLSLDLEYLLQLLLDDCGKDVPFC
jgi:hypothetical protein